MKKKKAKKSEYLSQLRQSEETFRRNTPCEYRDEDSILDYFRKDWACRIKCAVKLGVPSAIVWAVLKKNDVPQWGELHQVGGIIPEPKTAIDVLIDRAFEEQNPL